MRNFAAVPAWKCMRKEYIFIRSHEECVSIFPGNVLGHLVLQHFHRTARLEDDLVERPDVKAVAHLLGRLPPHLPDPDLAHLVSEGLPRPRDVPVHLLFRVTPGGGGVLHHVGDSLFARPPMNEAGKSNCETTSNIIRTRGSKFALDDIGCTEDKHATYEGKFGTP